MISTDPDLEAKAADAIESDLNPPAHLGAFSVDQKTALQALDGTHRMLPVAGKRRQPRRLAQAQRHAQPLRGVQYCNRRSPWQDGGAPHQRTVRSFPERRRCQPAQAQRIFRIGRRVRLFAGEAEIGAVAGCDGREAVDQVARATGV